jgi:lipoate-protein ligase B
MGNDNKGYILDLGLIDYKEAWDLQHDLWARRVRGEVPDLLLFLEHPHVITLGRRGNRSYLIASPEVLEAMAIPIYHVERGGDVTYHGPGQLVVYPIFNLKEYGYRLIRFVDQLEEVILGVLKDFGMEGRKDSLNRGVWVNGDKIASIGVTIKRWVSFHGFSLNYETDLKYFDLIHPCGLVGKKMTSMKKIIGADISRVDLIEKISLHFKEIFQKDWEEKDLSEVFPKSPLDKIFLTDQFKHSPPLAGGDEGEGD